MQIRYLSLLLIVFTEYGALKVKNSFALEASAQAYKESSTIQNFLYKPRNCNAQKHQHELRTALQEFIHGTYHIRNCISFGKPDEALVTLEMCAKQLDNIHAHLKPESMNKSADLLSFALELAQGIACLKKYLDHAEESLKNKDYQQAAATLEKMDIFRISFFRCFLQWDTKLDAVVEQIHAFETHIKAIEEVPSSSTVMHYMRSIVRNCVSHKGGNLFITITQAQMATLHADMRKIDEKLLLLRDEYDLQEYEGLELDKIVLWCGKWYINDYRKLCDSLKIFVEKINQHILQKQIIIPEALSWQEQALLKRLIALKKSTLFPIPSSTFADIQQSYAAVTSQVLHFSGQTTQMGFEGLGHLKELCKICETAVTPEGSFNKFLDTMVELASQLKEEKEIIKKIAQRVQTYKVEELIGFTDLMKNVVQLLEALVRADSHWGKLLQKINPQLHEFLQSSKGNKIGDALDSLKEISKTMGYKQPVSELALLCARHGTTIKLCCESLQGLVQASEPYFGASKHYFEEHEKLLKDQSQGLYAQALDVVLKNLQAPDIAQALHILASTSNEVTEHYKNPYEKLIAIPLEIESKYADEKRTIAQEQQDKQLQQELQGIWEIQCNLWRSEFQLERETETQQKSLAQWKKYRLGWLYARLHAKKQQNIIVQLQTQTTRLESDLRDASAEFIIELKKNIEERREKKHEPLCAQRLDSFIDAALLARNKSLVHHRILELEVQLQPRQPHQRPRLKWGNMTNLIKYMFSWLRYPFYRSHYLAQENSLRMAEFVKNKLRAQRQEFLNGSEATHLRRDYQVPDEICKRYLKLLHPLFSVL